MVHNDILIDTVSQVSVISSKTALRSWRGENGLYSQRRTFGVDLSGEGRVQNHRVGGSGRAAVRFLTVLDAVQFTVHKLHFIVWLSEQQCWLTVGNGGIALFELAAVNWKKDHCEQENAKVVPPPLVNERRGGCRSAIRVLP